MTDNRHFLGFQNTFHCAVIKLRRADRLALTHCPDDKCDIILIQTAIGTQEFTVGKKTGCRSDGLKGCSSLIVSVSEFQKVRLAAQENICNTSGRKSRIFWLSACTISRIVQGFPYAKRVTEPVSISEIMVREPSALLVKGVRRMVIPAL